MQNNTLLSGRIPRPLRRLSFAYILACWSCFYGCEDTAVSESPIERWILPLCCWTGVREDFIVNQNPYSLSCARFSPFKVLTRKVVKPEHTTAPSFESSELCTPWEVASLGVYDHITLQVRSLSVGADEKTVDSLHVPAETLTQACAFVCLVVGGISVIPC